MNKLFPGAQGLSLVAFGNRGREIAPAVISHAEGELRVEVRRLSCQHGLEFGYGPVEFAAAEIKHRVVVLFLQRHAHRQRHATHNDGPAQAAGDFSRKDILSDSRGFINRTTCRFKSKKGVAVLNRILLIVKEINHGLEFDTFTFSGLVCRSRRVALIWCQSPVHRAARKILKVRIS